MGQPGLGCAILVSRQHTGWRPACAAGSVRDSAGEGQSSPLEEAVAEGWPEM